MMMPMERCSVPAPPGKMISLVLSSMIILLHKPSQRKIAVITDKGKPALQSII